MICVLSYKCFLILTNFGLSKEDDKDEDDNEYNDNLDNGGNNFDAYSVNGESSSGGDDYDARSIFTQEFQEGTLKVSVSY